MMAAGETGPLIQEAKQKATALVEAFSETDKFHVFTSEFEGQDQRFLTQTEALERIAAAQLSHHAPSLEAVVQRSMDPFRRAEDASPRAFWITDLQKSTHDLRTMNTPGHVVAWHVLPVTATTCPMCGLIPFGLTPHSPWPTNRRRFKSASSTTREKASTGFR